MLRSGQIGADKRSNLPPASLISKRKGTVILTNTEMWVLVRRNRKKFSNGKYMSYDSLKIRKEQTCVQMI